MTKFEDANFLYEAGTKAIKPSPYKYGTQLFEMNHLLETAKLQRAFQTGTYEPQPGVKFEIKERGHVRFITSTATADKAVSHLTCDEYLTPMLEKYLQYDNSASQKGKGVAFHRHRFKVHLRQYYEREESNEGYILFSDFSGYYANILHDVALAQLEKYLAKEIADPAELEQVMGVLRTTFKTYELDVSRFSDEEIQRMYREKSQFHAQPWRSCIRPDRAKDAAERRGHRQSNLAKRGNFLAGADRQLHQDRMRNQRSRPIFG